MSQETKKGGVGFVVDGVADIPASVLEELGNIIPVPFYVVFGSQSYREGVDITSEQFYTRLAQPNEVIPKTQCPAPGEYLEAYKTLATRFDKIISIHASSKMTGALGSAEVARQMLPEVDITLIDSTTVSMVLGLYVIQAARAAKNGADVEPILKQIENEKRDTFTLFTSSTLKYIRHSGRVGLASYLVGSLLRIKPLFTFKDGTGQSAGRELNSDAAYLRIAKAAAAQFGDKPVYATIVHSVAPADAAKLKARAEQFLNIKEIIMSELGPTLGVHGGPGTVGLGAFSVEASQI
jgi:DegV family protein with EDD domain